MDSHLLEGVSRRVTNDVLTVVVTGESLSYPRIQSDLTDSTQLNSTQLQENIWILPPSCDCCIAVQAGAAPSSIAVNARLQSLHLLQVIPISSLLLKYSVCVLFFFQAKARLQLGRLFAA
jgi:hypothetical protein